MSDQRAVPLQWTDLGSRFDAERFLPFGPLFGRRFVHDAINNRKVRLTPGDPLTPLARPCCIGRSDVRCGNGRCARTKGGEPS